MGHLLLAGWLATCGGDVITTRIGLQRGAIELNPFAPHTANAHTLIVGGECLVSTWSAHKLSTTHPKVSRWLLIGGTLLESALVVNNIHQIHRLK